MKPFMDKDFMLNNDIAVRLYHDYAENMPIFDYHCHLSPQMIYEDKPFENITQIFLGGDHYKWRYMRSNGIDESYITGDKSDYEKFTAFCGCLQYAIGNPLYHWTHLEYNRARCANAAVKRYNSRSVGGAGSSAPINAERRGGRRITTRIISERTRCTKSSAPTAARSLKATAIGTENSVRTSAI